MKGKSERAKRRKKSERELGRANIYHPIPNAISLWYGFSTCCRRHTCRRRKTQPNIFSFSALSGFAKSHTLLYIYSHSHSLLFLFYHTLSLSFSLPSIFTSPSIYSLPHWSVPFLNFSLFLCPRFDFYCFFLFGVSLIISISCGFVLFHLGFGFWTFTCIGCSWQYLQSRQLLSDRWGIGHPFSIYI